MMKKMIFLFNPRSGKEAIKNQLSDILGIFCRAGYLPSVYVTQEPGDAAKIAEEYGSEVELFVCSGGDGTLNSVISGIMKLKNTTGDRVSSVRFHERFCKKFKDPCKPHGGSAGCGER